MVRGPLSRPFLFVGYWQVSPLTSQFSQVGLVSWHLIFRVLQLKQPARDFLWERRVRFGASVRCVRFSLVVETVSSNGSLLASRLGHEGVVELVASTEGVENDVSENMSKRLSFLSYVRAA